MNFYGPKSEFIVSGSDCANVFLWEKNTEKIVQCFHADEGGVVSFLSFEQRFISLLMCFGDVYNSAHVVQMESFYSYNRLTQFFM